MKAGKALKTLEERHAYLMEKADNCTDNRLGFVLGEAAALEFAMDAIARQLLEDRVTRAARYAVTKHLSEASC